MTRTSRASEWACNVAGAFGALAALAAFVVTSISYVQAGAWLSLFLWPPLWAGIASTVIGIAAFALLWPLMWLFAGTRRSS